jgi:hypothetical protein
MSPPKEPIRTAAKPSLRRELCAILVLYAAISVLPMCIGYAFGP